MLTVWTMIWAFRTVSVVVSCLSRFDQTRRSSALPRKGLNDVLFQMSSQATWHWVVGTLFSGNSGFSEPGLKHASCSRGQLKCDCTRTETRFRLSAKQTSLSRRGRQFSRLLAAEVCASVVVMLDTPCSEVVWRVLATHFIRQFPLHFPSCASPCAITFQLESACWQGFI